MKYCPGCESELDGGYCYNCNIQFEIDPWEEDNFDF